MTSSGRTRVYFILTSLLLLIHGLALADGKLEVYAKLQTTASGNSEVLFSIKNRSKEAIKLTDGELPWSDSFNTVILAVNTSGRVLKERNRFRDPIVQEIVTLKPGGELSGKVDLNGRFPNFEEERRKNRLIIFWTYSPDSQVVQKQAENLRFGGWLAVSEN